MNQAAVLIQGAAESRFCSVAGLHPRLATIARNLPRVARAYGFNARVTSGYRSPKKQAWLYDRYLRGLQPYPVAPPGHSEHEKGLAIDVVTTDLSKLVSLLTQVGLFWAGPSDPVHFQTKPLYVEATPKKQKKGLVTKILDVTSWAPGPVGIASDVLKFLF